MTTIDVLIEFAKEEWQLTVLVGISFLWLLWELFLRWEDKRRKKHNMVSDEQLKQRAAAGKIGGSRKVPKGFAVLGSDAASQAGKVGGAKGKRGKRKVQNNE